MDVSLLVHRKEGAGFNGARADLRRRQVLIDGETVDKIYTDLTARRGGASVDLTKARSLA